MRSSQFRRGFSVVELLIVMSLLVALMVGVFINGSRGIQQAGTRSLADIAAATFREARQRAITEGHPVAVMLPTDGGSRPHSQGYGIIEGDVPVITSVGNFAGEYPNACLAVGLTNANAVIDRPQLALASESFDFAAWAIASGHSEDYLFCFLPDGSLVTNDLPLFDGSYQVLVSSGLRYSGASAPEGIGWGLTPSYFQLTEGASPRRLVLSPLGEVSSTGIETEIAKAERLDFQAAPAPLPLLPDSTSGSSPDLFSIEVFPKPDPDVIPPGVEALVDVKEHLSLRVVARDSDPERRLHCRWESDRGGPFSRPDEHPMEWEQDADGPGVGAWVSRVEWRPPPGTEKDEVFELTAHVSDSDGGSDSAKVGALSGAAGATGRVQTIENSKIIFSSDRNGRPGIYSMLSDGSSVTFLTEGRNAILSPLGDQIFYARNNTLYLRAIGSSEEIEIITMPPEPAYDPHNNVTVISPVWPQAINSKGNLLAWRIGNSAYVAEFNGFSSVTPHRLNDDPGFVDSHASQGEHVDVAISPNGEYLSWDDNFHIYVAPFNEDGPVYLPQPASQTINITDTELGGSAAGDPAFSPDGTKLMFVIDNGGQLDIGSLNFDPATGNASGLNILSPDGA